MLDGRIRTVKDGRWLRTRQEWVEQYVAAKTIKPPEREVVELPQPRGRRHINAGIKLKQGGMGFQFLKERVAPGGGAEVGHVALSVAKYEFGRASTLVQYRQRWCEIRV